MRRARYTWQIAVIACTLGLLSACSILPETPIRDNYRLPVSSLSAPAQRLAPVDWSLKVVTPHSGRLLDGLGILVIRQDNQINIYKGAQWADTAPVLVRDRIMDAFLTDGRVQSVSHERTNLVPDLELRSDLRSFHVEYHENQPYVHIQLDASLIAPAMRHTIATRSFLVVLAAEGEQIPAIIQTFGAASDQLAQEVVEWVFLQ